MPSPPVIVSSSGAFEVISSVSSSVMCSVNLDGSRSIECCGSIFFFASVDNKRAIIVFCVRVFVEVRKGEAELDLFQIDFGS